MPESEGGTYKSTLTLTCVWLMPLQPPAVETKVHRAVENALWLDKFCGLKNKDTRAPKKQGVT